MLRAGRVGRPHGLDGSFYVIEPNPSLLALGASVTVDGRPLRITRRAGDDRRPIVRLEGYEDRAAVKAAQGQDMLVSRVVAPELEPDEWWPDDLVGCLVHDRGRRVGMVSKVLTLPSCDVLEVARDCDEVLLVPLVLDAVRSVDVNGKEIEIDLGFLGEA